MDLSLDKLKEFSKYLNHLGRNMKPISEFANPYISAILSTFFSYIFTSLLNDEKQKKWILEIVIYLVVLILTIIFVFLCAKMLLKLLFDNSMEENLCKDYKEIVDELIEEKENKHKEHCKWEILPSRNIME
ncbi:MAG: hypothetical protein J6J42_09675 [Lachnospiraceae bacterium]|nr:hypothetical protein [Lachnospiraceae bacterium]